MNPEVKLFFESMDVVRSSVRQSLEGMDSLGLNWNPLPGEANSLYAIVSHMCSAETYMIHRRIGGISAAGEPHNAFADRGDNPQELLSRLDEVYSTTRSLLEGLTSEDMDKAIDQGGGRPSRTAREWMGAHVRHMAQHLGHIEITKQFFEAGIVTGR